MALELKSMRIILVALVLLIAGGVYWFSSLPGLKKSGSEVSVVGCGGARDENATRVCPQLFCEKALLENPAIGVNATIKWQQSYGTANAGLTHIGVASQPAASSEPIKVMCHVKEDTVVHAGKISEADLNRFLPKNAKL